MEIVFCAREGDRFYGLDPTERTNIELGECVLYHSVFGLVFVSNSAHDSG